MAEPELHIGDKVQAEFKNGEGKTTAQFTGIVIDFDYAEPPKAQIQCEGFLAWVNLSMLKPADA